jgi:hypothetical protein
VGKQSIFFMVFQRLTLVWFSVDRMLMFKTRRLRQVDYERSFGFCPWGQRQPPIPDDLNPVDAVFGHLGVSEHSTHHGPQRFLAPFGGWVSWCASLAISVSDIGVG